MKLTPGQLLDQLLGAIARRLQPPSRPGPLRIKLSQVFETRNEIMASFFPFEVILPPLVTPHDVVSRELRVTVDGNDFFQSSVAYDEAKIVCPKVPQDAQVKLELTDVDDAGNRSVTPSVYAFVALDTVPPATPGELGVNILGEVIE